MSALVAAAECDAAGLCVVAVRADGTKAPVGSWRDYITHRSTPDQHRRWFTGTPLGIGIVYGAVSGNVEMIEFEGRAVREGILAEVTEVAEASGLGDEWRAIRSGWATESPSEGLHFRVRSEGAPVPGNTKLAQRLAREDEYTEAERRRVAANPTARIIRGLIETRGEGGFGVVEPSGGTVHPTGRPWRRVAGSPAGIPTIDADRVAALRDICRMSDRLPRVEVPRAESRPTSPPAGGLVRPGDAFEAADWSEVLLPAGWTEAYQRGRVRYWRHPAKDTPGISATTGRAADRDRLYVFSTSTEFTAEVPYTKFGAFALLNHGGDHVAAARDLAARGYGSDARSEAEKLADRIARYPIARAHNTLLWALRRLTGPDREGQARILAAGAVAAGIPDRIACAAVDRALNPVGAVTR